ncbi:MAG: helix-turn-helix transcriptional regulator [Acidimicrobiales bacterium]
MHNTVREQRQAKGLSKGALGEELGVSRQTINSIEVGRYIPSLPLAISLARFFGKAVEEMFHDDESDDDA